MDIKVELVNRFNLRNMHKVCNHKKCKRMPSKEVILIEVPKRGIKTRKELASLYFCENHYNTNIDNLLSDLNRIADNKKIDKKVNDIGYITS